MDKNKLIEFINSDDFMTEETVLITGAAGPVNLCYLKRMDEDGNYDIFMTRLNINSSAECLYLGFYNIKDKVFYGTDEGEETTGWWTYRSNEFKLLKKEFRENLRNEIAPRIEKMNDEISLDDLDKMDEQIKLDFHSEKLMAIIEINDLIMNNKKYQTNFEMLGIEIGSQSNLYWFERDLCISDRKEYIVNKDKFIDKIVTPFIEKNKKDCILAVLKNQYMKQEFEKQKNDPYSSVNVAKRIKEALDTIPEAKSFRITLKKDGKEFTGKYMMNSRELRFETHYKRMICGTTWGFEYQDRIAYSELFNGHDVMYPEDIVKITYKKHTVYEKGE